MNLKVLCLLGSYELREHVFHRFLKGVFTHFQPIFHKKAPHAFR